MSRLETTSLSNFRLYHKDALKQAKATSEQTKLNSHFTRQ